MAKEIERVDVASLEIVQYVQEMAMMLASQIPVVVAKDLAL